ncbi:MAG: aminodeoxychorismate synthase component I, partial [Myxococcota bacterium]|nr:aminodeoxychorismate synthase component I [Myxococcota bacterium]
SPMADPADTLRLAWRPLPPETEPLRAFEALRVQPNPWLLDSALRSTRLGRYSFAGAAARRVRASDFDAMRRVVPRLDPGVAAPPVPFIGGAVALLSYELGAQIESVSCGGVDDLRLPEATLLIADKVLAWDHEAGCAWACALGVGAEAERGLDELVGWLAVPVSAAPRRRPAEIFRNTRAAPTGFDEGAYVKAVDRVKHEIGAGNVYQANLSQRMERPFDADPWGLYRALRRINPAPFACYVELPELAVIGSSPERFLRVDLERWVESRPIKGTRPRGCHAVQDAALRAELVASEKDRAENLMIVDLVRNDLGRVCETGSVGVPELLAIEEYATVFHLVSTVTGRLRKSCDALDLVRAAFPPGSMTGAPKIAAMRLLDRLEPVRRGLYAGAIGYLDARGSADLSVVIRTLFAQRGRALVHAGGGVVADSDPHAEWRESLDKALPLLAALEDGAESCGPEEETWRPVMPAGKVS